MRQPTVSRHIMNLEEDLGVLLFERSHNRLALTADGKKLSDAIALGLTHVVTAVREVGARRPEDCITLACSLSFANCWLLPRFSALRQALDDYPVHLVTSYWLADLDVEKVDMVVSWRSDGTTGWSRLPLFDEVVYPVCSPAFRARRPELEKAFDDPARLLGAPLLFVQQQDPEFLDWEGWFSAHDLTFAAPPNQYRFSNYEFMMQAAIEGEGIAIAWHHLTDHYLEEGRLVRLGPPVTSRTPAYWLEYREERLPGAPLAIALDWFCSQATHREAVV